MMKENPEKFYDNIQIGAVYDSFPATIWSGGRINHYPPIPKYKIESTISMFNQLGVPVRFPWTNSQITEKYLNDPLCNLIMTIANTGENEVIVNSPILEDYLRETYPNFKYISSTTKCLKNNSEIIKELPKYYLTVLDYSKNHDMDFLSSLSVNDKNKIELLVNSYCSPDCAFRKKHYEGVSRINIGESINISEYVHPNCITHKVNFLDTLNYSCTITKEQLYNTYTPMGFKHFKIEGRTFNPCDVIESYIYYLVKPEYKDEIRLKLLRVAYPKRSEQII